MYIIDTINQKKKLICSRVNGLSITHHSLDPFGIRFRPAKILHQAWFDLEPTSTYSTICTTSGSILPSKSLVGLTHDTKLLMYFELIKYSCLFFSLFNLNLLK